MTLRDPAAETISIHLPLIEKLSRAEQEAKETEANRLRKQLLNAADATVIHAYLESTSVANPDLFRTAWQNAFDEVDVRKPLHAGGLKVLLDTYLATPTLDLTLLPPYSFSVQFTFTLAKPYLSKDDNPFYIIDNPIVRDKVFRLPLVRPSSWKGSLYAALWQLGHRRENDDQSKRLFGDIRDDESGQAGRLIFFPTFFETTALEIINPHDRVRKVGKNPILFECVPAGATGTFSLLYVPFDRIGQDEAQTRAEAAADLRLVAEAVAAMFCDYGFGAKTSSGFGVAQETVNGTLTVRAEAAAPASQPAASVVPSRDPSLPRYLAAPGQLQPEYLTPKGTFRERTEAELKAMNKASRQEYDKARKWWEREGKSLASQPPSPAPVASPVPPPLPAPTLLSEKFASFEELAAQVEKVAVKLTGAQHA